jgi:hypothetical protein
MPFGKWRGKPMQDVPAGYLCWLWNQDDFVKKGGAVCDYIASHLDALAQEHPDGIWENRTKQQPKPDERLPF